MSDASTVPLDEPAAPKVSRRLLLGLLGVAALALLALFLLLPMLTGAPPVDIAFQPPPEAAPMDPADADAGAGSDGAAPQMPIEVVAARDPFRQLASADTATATGEAGTATTVAASDPTTTATTTADSTTTATTGTVTGATEATTGATEATTTVPGTRIGTRAIRLDGVRSTASGPVADVRVDGQEHQVVPGSSFAGNLLLSGIDGQCATFQLATSRFTLCAGEELRK